MNEPTSDAANRSDGRGISRRDFSRRAVAFGLGACLVPGAALCSEDNDWVVSCRDMHWKAGGQKDCWASLKALGAEGVEVSVAPDLSCPNLGGPNRKYTLATDEGIALLKRDAQAAGCAITAFLMANRLEERLEEEVKWTRNLVKASVQLQVKAIRIDVWPVKLSREQFLPFAVDACRRLCETAEGTPVRFGIENHGKVTNDPQFLDQLFERVGSTRLGLTLDCANLYWFGHPLKDLYAIYEHFAPKVVHTHCKSIGYPQAQRESKRPMGWEYDKYASPIDQGDIDFKRLLSILRKANYRGDLCLEDESLPRFPEAERAAIVRRELSMLKELRKAR